jgi:putative nucleotidyltransferase with HDIG domain
MPDPNLRTSETRVVSAAQATAQREMLGRRKSLTNRLAKLPVFHPAAVRLLGISVESGSAVREFEEVFGSDPALAVDLLTIANSPLYGFNGRVNNIRHAITLLGLETVRSLAFTVAMNSLTRGSSAKEGIRAVCSHGVATAVVGESLAPAFGVSASLVYTAGLLHDIGRLGLLAAEPERYADVTRREYQDIGESLLVEQFAFGYRHDEAGAFLGRTWGLPDALCECIGSHHTEPAPVSGNLTATIQTACRIAGALGFQEVNHSRNTQEPEEFLAGNSKLELHRDQLIGRIHQLSEALQWSAPGAN